MSYHFRDLLLNFGLLFSASELTGKINPQYHNALSAAGWGSNVDNVALKDGLSEGDIHSLRCLYQLDRQDCD